MELKKINDYEWEIPKEKGMHVPARVFASEKLLPKMKEDSTFEQVKNVAYLPGIYKHAIVLPDGHSGYGFPIGGVAALDYEHGGISPGGIGYDINCGVRLLGTDLTLKEIRPKIKEVVDALFKGVPAGVGSESKIKLSSDELDEVLSKGAEWAVKNGYGNKKDIEHTEAKGCLKPNNPEFVSSLAKKRGRPQLGSLGAGNHFLEIEFVESIDNKENAKTYGLSENQIGIMIHCGSRGLGHQVCSDYLRDMEKANPQLVKSLPDRELIYAPSGSELADKYFKAMNCAANYAWANRQMLTYFVRNAVNKVFPKIQMDMVYDVCHNVAKIEEYVIDGKKVKVYVHRKGATRSFPPYHEEIPSDYQKAGQPVLLPGHMGTGSYVLSGTKEAMEKSFGSAPHGAGRVMSRHESKRKYTAEEIKNELLKQGIIVKATTYAGISEEAPGAYKSLEDVAEVSHNAKLALKVARLKPIGVVKG
ncbi:MAG: RtcB family protein [Candidatus Nanoarchaeia archaeon]|nr:RtcB family protein [Candidatus Nanoarchaeia archaeon]